MNSSRQKLPWALRWVILKNALQGQLPSKWEDWANKYAINEQNLEEEKNVDQKADRELELKQLKNKWIETYQQSKPLNFNSKIQLYTDYLRMIWMSQAPSSLVAYIAEERWLSKKPENRNRSMLDWALFSSPKPQQSYLIEQLNEQERLWLLGWSIAIRDQEFSSKFYQPQNDLMLQENFSLITWMTIFDSDCLKTLLEHHPKEINKTDDYNFLKEKIIKLCEKFETKELIHYFPNGWDLTFLATKWGSTKALKEFCLRGESTNSLSKDKRISTLWTAVDNLDIVSCEILAEHGACGFTPQDSVDGALAYIVEKFQPGLNNETKERWLNLVKTILVNPIEPFWRNEKTPSIENQINSLAFQAIKNQREPDLVQLFYETLDKKNMSYNWIWTTWEKKEDKTTNKKEKVQTLFDISLQSDNPKYIEILAGHGIDLDLKKLYQLALIKPEGLQKWLDTVPSNTIQQWISEPTPDPMSPLEVRSTNPLNYNWKEDWNFWDVALFGLNPVVAYQTILNHPAFNTLITPQLLFDLKRASWQIDVEKCLEIHRIIKEKVNSSPSLSSYSSNSSEPIFFNKILQKNHRNLYAVESLIQEQYLPLTCPANEEGDCFTHLVIQNQDKALFDILLKYNVDFEVPNAKGETALNLARSTNPAWYQILVEHQKQQLQQHLSTAPESSKKTHRL